MYCLYCGDCCKRMSPISHPKPCPNVVTDGDFIFCGDYENRPIECQKHEFPARFCPIGLNVLHLDTEEDTRKIRERIELGYELSKIGNWEEF